MSGRQIPQLLHALSAQPLVMERRTLETLVQVFRRKLAGGSFNGQELHAELAIAAPRARQASRETPTIAVIPIQGMISQHSQSLGTSTDEIGAMFDRALANPEVDAILLDVDSPGGTIGGVPELGDKMLAAKGQKPIWAFANGLMASAAYWIGSVADEVVVTPSGLVGSIGVYMLHEDWSQNLAQEGVKVTAVSAGKYKTEGAPWEPLSLEAESHIRSLVEEAYGWFVQAVSKGRKDSQANVRNGYGEGRVLGATDALRAKLVDRVATWEETVGRLATKVKRKTYRSGPSADLLGRKLALDTVAMEPQVKR